jgi:sugar phosphate isomerase/epimerase
LRLAVSSWSLRDHIEREFSISDFPAYVVDKFGVRAVEICQVHVYPLDSVRLDMLAEGLSASDVRVVNMPVDVGDISQPDSYKRNFDLKIIETWIDAAAYLKSPAVRVNSGSGDISTAMSSYRELAEYGDAVGVKVLLENHGGLSADLDNIVALMSGVGPNFATCPDFGNFAEEARYKGLEIMAPRAAIIHAKTYDFDTEGEFEDFDFARCLKIFQDAGYKGYVSIEFEGDTDQPTGVKNTMELLRRLDPSIEP